MSRPRSPTTWLATLLLAAAGLGACAEAQPYVWVRDLPLPAEERAIVGLRDSLLVFVRNQATLSGEFVVRDDGTYLQPMLGNVAVAGREPSAIASELQARLRGIIAEPDVSVSIVKAAPVRVSVVGEVRAPGSYELQRDRSVVSALALAGWLTDFAHRDSVFVVRPGQRPAPGRPASAEARVRFTAAALTASEPHAARFQLRDGDIVVVE
jgi:polysaccharide export outer membrane protein